MYTAAVTFISTFSRIFETYKEIETMMFHSFGINFMHVYLLRHIRLSERQNRFNSPMHCTVRVSACVCAVSMSQFILFVKYVSVYFRLDKNIFPIFTWWEHRVHLFTYTRPHAHTHKSQQQTFCTVMNPNVCYYDWYICLPTWCICVSASILCNIVKKLPFLRCFG